MRVLVTGADGFVGSWVVRELLRSGHHVVGGIRIGGALPHDLAEGERLRVQWVDFDLLSADSVNELARLSVDGVIHLAAVASGADGLVCSPLEVAMLRQAFGSAVKLVVPGIRPDRSAAGDQARTMTPAQAVVAGADWIVVGRPITAAKDPHAAALAITQEMAQVAA